LGTQISFLDEKTLYNYERTVVLVAEEVTSFHYVLDSVIGLLPTSGHSIFTPAYEADIILTTLIYCR
jgi:hypothetical protein